MTATTKGHSQRSLREKFRLTTQLAWREINGRYAGSWLGIFWSLLNPIFMLSIYTFVFGVVYRARWSQSSEQASTAEFALILFTGLVVFNLFAEVVNRAPTLILANASYVKKVVFPLEILAPVSIVSALFHTAVSVCVLLVMRAYIFGGIPASACFLPAIIAPLAVLLLGASWFLSSLGVFLRDISQIIGTFVTALLFLSPIFFPTSSLPEWLQPWIRLNPIALPVEETRKVILWGELPDFVGLAVYSAVAVAFAALGYLWFIKTRKGFADVL